MLVMKNAFQKVFTNTRYVILSIFISFFMFFIFVLTNNFSAFVTMLEINPSVKLFFEMITNGSSNILYAAGPVLFVSIIVVCILSGITISMIAYQFQVRRSFGGKKNLAGIGGILGGGFASACSACSATLASVMGTAGGLAIFPLNGLEFSLPSIGILVVSMYFISKGLVDSDRCKI